MKEKNTLLNMDPEKLLNIIHRKDSIERKLRNEVKKMKAANTLLELRVAETISQKAKQKLSDLLKVEANEGFPQLPIEIEYLKPDGKSVNRHLRSIRHSDLRGESYIEAECAEAYDKILTFSINRIIHVKFPWTRISSKDDVAKITGIYTFACYGDNHIEHETYILQKGDRLWKFFEGIYEHAQGCFTIEPFAYHAVQAIK